MPKSKTHAAKDAPIQPDTDSPTPGEKMDYPERLSVSLESPMGLLYWLTRDGKTSKPAKSIPSSLSPVPLDACLQRELVTQKRGRIELTEVGQAVLDDDKWKRDWRIKHAAKSQAYDESDKAKVGPQRRKAILAHLADCETLLAERDDVAASFVRWGDAIPVPPKGDTTESIIACIQEQFPGTPAEIIHQDIETELAEGGEIRKDDTNVDGLRVWRIAGGAQKQNPETLPPGWQRLVVTEGGGDAIAELDGIQHRLGRSDAVPFLRALQKAEGNTIKGTALDKAIEGRSDRIYKTLPKALKQIIDQPGQGACGYRML